MEPLPNQTWDSITNNLRQYDRADMNLKKETLNAASNVITCYGCGQTGHKRPDCPNRGKGKGNGRGRGNGGGKGSGKGFSGGRGQQRNQRYKSGIVIFVTRRVIFPTPVRMRKNFNKFWPNETIQIQAVTYRNDAKNMMMTSTA